MRMTGVPFPHQQDRDHLQSLKEKANARGLAKTGFLAKKGDALFGMPISFTVGTPYRQRLRAKAW
jgi:hypothetical protein